MRIHPMPHPTHTALFLLAGLIFGSTGCGPREDPPPPVSAAPSPLTSETKPEPGAPAGPAPAVPSQGTTAKIAPPHIAPPAAKPLPTSTATATKGVPASAPMATVPSPAPEMKPVAPAQVVSPVSDPGGEVAVQPTKAGLTRVGAVACKMCHKVQFASWSETAHARRSPPLDCESCHGPGSEYKSISAMKDPAKAKAAGLVLPGALFCATCHKRNWNDGMLKKAHAHKT